MKIFFFEKKKLFNGKHLNGKEIAKVISLHQNMTHYCCQPSPRLNSMHSYAATSCFISLWLRSLYVSCQKKRLPLKNRKVQATAVVVVVDSVNRWNAQRCEDNPVNWFPKMIMFVLKGLARKQFTYIEIFKRFSWSLMRAIAANECASFVTLPFKWNSFVHNYSNVA